jgi:hypothetical protein
MIELSTGIHGHVNGAADSDPPTIVRPRGRLPVVVVEHRTLASERHRCVTAWVRDVIVLHRLVECILPAFVVGAWLALVIATSDAAAHCCPGWRPSADPFT